MKPRIADEEWCFMSIPDDHLIEACIWEYAREVEWIRQAVRFEGSEPLPDEILHWKDALRVDPYTEKRVVLEDPCVIRRHMESGSINIKPSANDQPITPIKIVELRVERLFQSDNSASPAKKVIILRFSDGFPALPYASAANPVATLEHPKFAHRSGIGFPEKNAIYSTVTNSSYFWQLLADQAQAEEEKSGNGTPWEYPPATTPPPIPGRIPSLSVPPIKNGKREYSRSSPGSFTWWAQEENGLEADQHPYVLEGWRKCNLCIDFYRTDEMLLKDFAAFLKDFRKITGLKSLEKKDRPKSSGLPSWLTWRFARDALGTLASRRLIRAFDGDAEAATKYLLVKPGRINVSFKETMKRSSNPKIEPAERMFGKAFG